MKSKREILLDLIGVKLYFSDNYGITQITKYHSSNQIYGIIRDIGEDMVEVNKYWDDGKEFGTFYYALDKILFIKKM